MIINVELVKKESKEKSQLLVSMVMDAGPIPTNRFDIFSPVERMVQKVCAILCGLTNSLPKTCEVETIETYIEQKNSQGTIKAGLRNPVTNEKYDLILKPQSHQTFLEDSWVSKMGLPVEHKDEYLVNMMFEDGTVLESVKVLQGNTIFIPVEFRGKAVSDVVVAG